jgi:hypothetical protein
MNALAANPSRKRDLARIELLLDTFVADAFAASRMPRSDEYRYGVRALLEFRALGGRLTCPYDQGGARADAWFAGVEEGKAMWIGRVQALVQLVR